MVYCCVVGCFNRSDRGPDSRRNLCSNREGDHNVSFYRLNSGDNSKPRQARVGSF